ncbi:hypothetical protein [Microbacterium sulfonylureivorans]|uniref:hypothetical protein n=1 Tax=Microbacterium sulfonylureivorans TaxID=2486854 RepID=UPI000FDAA8BF|nr:hypothetical protein [Microbacterium sulfonylureivorans]
MKQVWIVYHDSSPDNNILGVFDDEDEAYAYQEAVAPGYPDGALLTPFPVPWRSTDHVTEIRIG